MLIFGKPFGPKKLDLWASAISHQCQPIHRYAVAVGSKQTSSVYVTKVLLYGIVCHHTQNWLTPLQPLKFFINSIWSIDI